MLIQYAVRAWLLDWTSVTTLLGAGTTESPARIYPVTMPQAPDDVCLVYRRISTSRDRDTDGPTGLTMVRIAFDIFSPIAADEEGYNAAWVVFEALRAVLDGKTLTMGGASGVQVQDCRIENERDDYSDELRAYRVSFEALLYFGEQS